MHLTDTCLTGRCEVEEVQKYPAQHLVPGSSLLLLLSVLRAHLHNHDFPAGLPVGG